MAETTTNLTANDQADVKSASATIIIGGVKFIGRSTADELLDIIRRLDALVTERTRELDALTLQLADCRNEKANIATDRDAYRERAEGLAAKIDAMIRYDISDLTDLMIKRADGAWINHEELMETADPAPILAERDRRMELLTLRAARMMQPHEIDSCIAELARAGGQEEKHE